MLDNQQKYYSISNAIERVISNVQNHQGELISVLGDVGLNDLLFALNIGSNAALDVAEILDHLSPTVDTIDLITSDN